ncbi:hypothetical protein LZK75_17135 [Rhizobium leguminosarum]|nr:hypothetical protein LZK75_17135 [Rhizobium leguminosarum]
MNTITQSPVEKIPEAPQINYAAPATNWRRLFGLRERGVYYALLLLIAVITLLTSYLGQSNYLSVLNLSNVVYQSSLMAIMAVAMTVVLISGNFDLSVASVAALAAVILIRQCRRDWFHSSCGPCYGSGYGNRPDQWIDRPVPGH